MLSTLVTVPLQPALMPILQADVCQLPVLSAQHRCFYLVPPVATSAPTAVHTTCSILQADLRRPLPCMLLCPCSSHSSARSCLIPKSIISPPRRRGLASFLCSGRRSSTGRHGQPPHQHRGLPRASRHGQRGWPRCSSPPAQAAGPHRACPVCAHRCWRHSPWQCCGQPWHCL